MASRLLPGMPGAEMRSGNDRVARVTIPWEVPVQHTPSLFRLRFLRIAAGAAFLTCSAFGQRPEEFAVNVLATQNIDATGNARVNWVMSFNPPRGYDRVKRMYPNLYVLFRDLGPERSSFEINRASLKVASDDGQRTITFGADVLGLAVSRNNRWQVELQANEQVSSQEGNRVTTVLPLGGQNGLKLTIIGSYALPPAAQSVQVDKDAHLLTYALPSVRSAPGEPVVDASVRFKKRLMAAVYKVYGDPEAQDGSTWVAKTILRNTGKTPLYNLKIYYKLGEFADMTVPEAYSVIPPGGAVVDRYYPVIQSRVAQLKTPSPVQLYIKYEYKDASGRPYSNELTKRLEILGINQFEFSNLNDEDRSDTWFDYFNNAPLLAAFVTRTDEAVKQFAGYVSEASGGAAAASSKEDAVRWLRAAYLMELANNIVYQTPSGFLTNDRSSGQDIKYPRDVFRDKSGTCVDLAITYAALAEAVGLKASIMMVPGHAFPVIHLPGGDYLPVEATGLGGGDRRLTFEKAVEAGSQELQKYISDGVFYLINVQEQWSTGRVPNPELASVGVDFLEKSGIQRIGALQANAAAGQQGPAPRNRMAGGQQPSGQIASQQDPLRNAQMFRVVHDHGMGMLTTFCVGILAITPDAMAYQAERANDGRVDRFAFKKSDIREVRKNRVPLGQGAVRFEAFHIRLANGVNLNFANIDQNGRGLSADPIVMALSQ